MNTYQLELESCVELIPKLKKLFLQTHKNVIIKKKSEDDITTNIDLQSEKIILQHLQKRFSKDGFLGEEEFYNLDRLGKKRVWLIDPLDGTGNFKKYLENKQIKKNELFGVHIGLLEKNEPVFGFIYYPIRNLVFYGIKNKGSYIVTNGIKRRLLINNSAQNIELANSIFENPKTKSERSLPHSTKENFGNVFGYCIIAISINLIKQYYCYPTDPNRVGEWDVCAPMVILTEAGGKITDYKGNELVFNKEEPYFNKGIIASI